MTIYIASDHAGYRLKEKIIAFLEADDYRVVDLGAHALDPDDDYNEYAEAAAEAVLAHPADRAILFCASGQGMAIAANRYPKIRAVVVFDEEMAAESRDDNDANILAIATKYTDEKTVKKIIDHWLETPFSHAERHIRRIQKLDRKWLS